MCKYFQINSNLCFIVYGVSSLVNLQFNLLYILHRCCVHFFFFSPSPVYLHYCFCCLLYFSHEIVQRTNKYHTIFLIILFFCLFAELIISFVYCIRIVVSSLRNVPKPGYGLKSSTLPVTRNGYVSTRVLRPAKIFMSNQEK